MALRLLELRLGLSGGLLLLALLLGLRLELLPGQAQELLLVQQVELLPGQLPERRLDPWCRLSGQLLAQASGCYSGTCFNYWRFCHE